MATNFKINFDSYLTHYKSFISQKKLNNETDLSVPKNYVCEDKYKLGPINNFILYTYYNGGAKILKFTKEQYALIFEVNPNWAEQAKDVSASRKQKARQNVNIKE